jgi:uncharacterized membrane protein YphA (DoxX/SURF4 family)
MTIWTLLIGFAIGGGILTGLTWRFQKSHFQAFLQNFTGVWFIFSGIVKAIDPWGTAFKMQQYFGEFETTFKGTSLKSIAGIFPWLSDYALSFSIAMIVLEIVIGVMLITGYKSKLTSWLFLIIMVFFTALTGYTHLTGYVPDGVNFFDFSKWGEYVKTNMKVTDCGCFGDFLKLNPTVSFYKDLGLMPIAIFFVWKYKNFTPLFTARIRGLIVGLSIVGSLAFCLFNSFGNEPIVDFRPFKNGVNIRERKEAEEKAAAAVKITGWKLKNDKTGEVKEVPDAEYMGNLTTYNKENGWSVVDQIKTEPTLEHSKISDFSVNNKDGEDVAEQLLTDPNYTIWITSWKMKATSETKIVVVPDSIFKFDTIRTKMGGVDTFSVQKTFVNMGQREEKFKSFRFDEDYRKAFEGLNGFVDKAEKAGVKTLAIVPFNDPKKIEDFRHAAQTAYPFYTADDILLKTMIRSNPGIFLMKNGQIVQKWHISKLPEFDEIKLKFLR